MKLQFQEESEQSIVQLQRQILDLPECDRWKLMQIILDSLKQ